jgi:hypothetical protein
MSAGLQILHTESCVKGKANPWVNDNREADFDAVAFIDQALCRSSHSTTPSLET